MSDLRPPPGGEGEAADHAYVQAEAVLDDEAARGRRRAAVLEAVKQQANARPPLAAMASPPRIAGRPPLGRRLAWLPAACVAGLSVVVALRFEPALAPKAVRAPSRAAPATTLPSRQSPLPAQAAPAAEALRATPRKAAALQEEDAAAAAKTSKRPSPPMVPRVTPPPPSNMSTPPPPPAPVVAPAAPAASLTLAGGGEARPLTRAAPAASLPDESRQGAALRAAAAAGRTDELEAILVTGVQVDAADPDGTTALMQSIEADRPHAVALLVRHGADPERKNRAGESARDLAAREGDPALPRALDRSPK